MTNNRKSSKRLNKKKAMNKAKQQQEKMINDENDQYNCTCNMDHKKLMDNEILKSLLKLEEKYVLSSSYFQNFQTKINSSMRRRLATWMLEVCEVEKCTDDIYSLAMNLFDRLLCVIKVNKMHLQLLGTVCLFIASKLKSTTTTLNAKSLCEYTDNSINIDELLDWELLVLNKLKWDIASITANDFIDIFIHRCMKKLNDSNINVDKLRKHCLTLIALCSTDICYSLYPSSMIAAATILSSIDTQLSNQSNQEIRTSICYILNKCANIDNECLLALRESIDDLFERTCNASTAEVEIDDDCDCDYDYDDFESTNNNQHHQHDQQKHKQEQQLLTIINCNESTCSSTSSGVSSSFTITPQFNYDYNDEYINEMKLPVLTDD